MRSGMVLLAILWAGVASAHDWERLDQRGIVATLSGRGVAFEGVLQQFRPDGTTTLEGAVTRRGLWRIEGAKLCHDLMPGGWACFAVDTLHGELVRFVGDRGITVDGALVR